MTVHIIGTGLAGLSCAVRLVGEGASVTLYEAAREAGGRCRSITRKTDGRQVECGLHLLLSHQKAAFAYIADTDAHATLVKAPGTGIRFVDLQDGVRWHLRPSAGLIPWWTIMPGRTVPGSGLRDWLAMARICFAGPEAIVGDFVPRNSPSRRRLWEPSIVAALNTTAEHGLAREYWGSIRGSLFGGAEASRVSYARDGLSATFVTPALSLLERRGSTVRYGARLAELAISGERVAGLRFRSENVALGPDDQIVLAVPAGEAARLCNDLVVPHGSSGIVTVAYFPDQPLQPVDQGALFALVGERTEWVLLREDKIIVTIGAADGLIGGDHKALAQSVWRNLSVALARGDVPMPDWHVLPFTDGTFAQTSANSGRRPGPHTGFDNLFLAGDWTDTGYPASIESAVRSGHRTAGLVSRNFHRGSG